MANYNGVVVAHTVFRATQDKRGHFLVKKWPWQEGQAPVQSSSSITCVTLVHIQPFMGCGVQRMNVAQQVGGEHSLPLAGCLNTPQNTPLNTPKFTPKVGHGLGCMGHDSFDLP